MSRTTNVVTVGAAVDSRIALAATDETALHVATRATGEALLTGQPRTVKTPVEAVSAVLEAAFGALDDELRSTAPLYVLCDDYSIFAARRLVTRCHETHRRLRPSDSVRPETSELVRPYLTAAGHQGSCYLLAGVSAEAVVELATSAGHRAVVICEPALLPGDDPHHRDCLAVAAAWGSGEPPVLPATTSATPSALLNALSSERQWNNA
ncbi:hypothetical protein GCM10010329_69200 [Streptomyces spiroverticillatus]|uniref:Uncharacterized protein n=1 Tax=Streptomyces finlayi TaxID=67296 RepID=A0A919CDP6_9ACTN|nr:flavodoxin family protein [Streptomyces finlayi]GHA36071.1 hypothetical protein GCM10010329_69200 [Streptomyces spiroverticillatus]GHD12462.1 hypothetical protein GCM10010334_69480 [Streptomyces finlayi]